MQRATLPKAASTSTARHVHPPPWSIQPDAKWITVARSKVRFGAGLSAQLAREAQLDSGDSETNSSVRPYLGPPSPLPPLLPHARILKGGVTSAWTVVSTGPRDALGSALISRPHRSAIGRRLPGRRAHACSPALGFTWRECRTLDYSPRTGNHRSRCSLFRSTAISRLDCLSEHGLNRRSQFSAAFICFQLGVCSFCTRCIHEPHFFLLQN